MLPIISLGSDVKKRRRLQSFGPIFSSFSDSLSAGQSSTYFLLESRRIFLPLHVIKWPAITYDFPGVIFRVLLGFCHGQDFQRLKSETSGRPILEKRSSTNPIISDTTNFNSFLIGLIIMEEFCIFAASFFIITWGAFFMESWPCMWERWSCASPVWRRPVCRREKSRSCGPEHYTLPEI